MDAQHLEAEALAAVAAAASAEEIEQVRVEYLGRKSELKLALRDVRDRESGMALNTLARAARGGHRRPRARSCDGQSSTAG